MFDRAVVIGGSLAGLFSAAVLARSFRTVTVVEKDPLDTPFAPRKGVPQGRHVHNLLARGDEVIAHLFPTLFAKLSERGAVRVDWSQDVRWHHHGVWKQRAPSGVESWLMSRALLEGCVREALGELENVEVQLGTVEALRLDDEGGVVGVVTTDGHLPATLVVDCSGCGTRGPQWLEQAGFGATPESVIHADVVYATRQMRPRNPPPFKVLAQVAASPSKQSSVAFQIEGDRWMVTLFGYHGEHPPGDDEGWRAFARSQGVPDMAALIDDSEPLTDIVTYRFPASRWRRFEQLARRPGRFVALGDSVCSFNPIYGQGMTSAALQAEALGSALSGCASMPDLDQAIALLPAGLARIVNECWQAVASEDFRYAETTGDRHRAASLINWYTQRVHRTAGIDVGVAHQFVRVMHMQASITSLLRPSLLLRVLAKGGRA